MSDPRQQTAVPGLRARTAVVVLVLAFAAACSTEPPFEPPDLAEWAGEPQVAAKIRAAREAAIAEPRSAAATGRLGTVFHAHELLAEAATCYRRAAELEPRSPRWPYLAALVTARNDLAAAVTDFERAVALQPGQPAVHVNYGDVLFRLGRADEAAAQYRRALDLAPATTHALYGLAQIDLAGGDAAAAARALEQAAGLAPWHGEVHALLAQVYRRLGRDAEAQLELLRAGAVPEATRTPDPWLAEVEAEAVSSRAYAERGRRRAADGAYAGAEQAFRKVLELRPGDARDFTNLGGALAGQGRREEAIEQYERALTLAPDDTYALNNLALALAAGGELDAAAEHLARAIELDPTYADAHRNLGLLRARQERHEDAIEHYRAALAADPSSAPAHNDLGTSLGRLGRVDEAIGHWRRAIEIDRREVSAVFNLGVALVGRGAHAEAIERLREGLESAPNSSRLASLLAWELATAPDPALRDGAAAERLARRVAEAYPEDPQAGDVLAAALAAQGRFDEAAPLAERAAALARTAGRTALAARIGARAAAYRRSAPRAE